MCMESISGEAPLVFTVDARRRVTFMTPKQRITTFLSVNQSLSESILFSLPLKNNRE